MGQDDREKRKKSTRGKEKSRRERPQEGDEDWLGAESEDHLYDDWDELASDPEEASRLSRALEGILPDIVRRGVGGLVSDDGLRALVKDRELPREAVGFIMGQVDATKREVVRMVSKEVRMFLENADLGGELTKILTSISFEIRTEVRFIPNDSAVKPNVRSRVRVRGKEAAEGSAAEAEDDGTDDDSADRGQKQEQGEANGDGEPRRRRWSLRGRGAPDAGAESGDEGDKEDR